MRERGEGGECGIGGSESGREEETVEGGEREGKDGEWVKRTIERLKSGKRRDFSTPTKVYYKHKVYYKPNFPKQKDEGNCFK